MSNQKENPYSEYFNKMKNEEAQAEIDYKEIVEQDKNKTYLDLLPPDFKNFKRSIIKRTILRYIDLVTDFLNNCSLYDGRVFDKKEVVRYMMKGTAYSNFYLAYKFIPRKSSDSLWMKYVAENKPTNFKDKQLDNLYEKFENENKDVIKEYRDLEHHLQCLKQAWESYEDRQKIKKGELVNSYDMEDDGYPRTGRGALCYLFTPVKGNLPENKKGTFNLYNPRNKKNLEYKILGYKKEDKIYSCLDENGKKVFLISHQEVADAFDCLFTSNKEIFSGWWNKTLILK
jgi:hypothetical protein